MITIFKKIKTTLSDLGSGSGEMIVTQTNSNFASRGGTVQQDATLFKTYFSIFITYYILKTWWIQYLNPIFYDSALKNYTNPTGS